MRGKLNKTYTRSTRINNEKNCLGSIGYSDSIWLSPQYTVDIQIHKNFLGCHQQTARNNSEPLSNRFLLLYLGDALNRTVTWGEITPLQG